MTHTVDTLMALADVYAEQMHRCGVGRLSQDNRAAFRSALTEALESKGCISNCENCTYHHQSPAQAGYCYMFYEEPLGVCGQWKDANPNISEYPEKDISAQPAQRTAGCTLCGHCAATGEKIQAAKPVREPTPGACKSCGNEYLASRTDVYKDKRPFIYCDCCGAIADRKTWYLTHGIGGDK
jgi:hypothetical protein